jgi:hypothetical protein
LHSRGAQDTFIIISLTTLGIVDPFRAPQRLCRIYLVREKMTDALPEAACFCINLERGSCTEQSSTMSNDSVQAVASHQEEWRTLPIVEKIGILQEMSAIWNAMTMEQLVEYMGCADAQVMGFAPTTLEGQFEAAQSAFFYVVAVRLTVTKLLETYQYHHDQSKQPNSIRPYHPLLDRSALPQTSPNGKQIIVPTSPLFWSDRLFGPFTLASVEVWLNSGAPFQPLAVNHFLQDSEDTYKDGCMVVLAAGNHCFLSSIDCLHGLFQCNRVVYLKHSPVRPHHDALVRHLLAPLIRRGYFGCEVHTTLARSQHLVYHPCVAHVHLTGGKAAHDAIVWGSTSDGQRSNQPVLQAKMTSELGCVTPWIIAPGQRWTKRQLRHHARHLFASLYNNAGANCNSPKVLVLPRDWPYASDLVELLISLMKKHPLPVSYYPGTLDRWTAFRNAYPGDLAQEYGGTFSAQQRPPLDTAAASEWLLPWLVVDGIHVDLSTEAGRQAARTEYAFGTEPFAPVLTIAYIDDNSLETAVAFANDYLFGALSCTIVAPQSRSPDVQAAIANLRYGAVGVNCWSAANYVALCGTWGAFPGETLDNVQSGIGQVHNLYFIREVEKTVVRSWLIDPLLHFVPKPARVARNECMALGDWILQPGLYTLINAGAAKLTGFAFPSSPTPSCTLCFLTLLLLMAAMVVHLTVCVS